MTLTEEGPIIRYESSGVGEWNGGVRVFLVV